MLPELLLLFHLAATQPQNKADSNVVLASHTISMEDRYNNKFVNDVFKYNILLAVKYMGNKITLTPGQVFAFHDSILPSYKANLAKTTNAHFNSAEGFKYDGDLVGDGVCHLASLMYWTALDAGLTSYAPSNHNFAKINDIDPKYGVAIQAPMPMGNLYITNNLDKPVTFEFDYDGTNLTLKILTSE